jgi:hypothetical protein
VKPQEVRINELPQLLQNLAAVWQIRIADNGEDFVAGIAAVTSSVGADAQRIQLRKRRIRPNLEMAVED